MACRAGLPGQAEDSIQNRTGGQDYQHRTAKYRTAWNRTKPNLKIVYFTDKINIGTVLLGKYLTGDCTLCVYYTILICIIMASYILPLMTKRIQIVIF
jgi:hypothetical protein